MPFEGMPIDELRLYRPALEPPHDLASFWSATLDDARSLDIAASFSQVSTALQLVDTYDVTFRGFAGHPIRGWLQLPARSDGPLPAIVEYVGYGGGRGLPHQHLRWPVAGYAHLVMDTRGQGSLWRSGGTSDSGSDGAPRFDGLLTDGIQSPETYYYRRLITDGVRAVEAVRRHPAVDGSRVAVTGGSQGGGICIAVAGLVSNLVAAMADVPFLSDFPRAIRLSEVNPYTQIAGYLKIHRERVAEVERTLSYFDVTNLGRSATAPALFSVGLMDTVCPPSTVYAAYNCYGGPKEVREYEFNDHEGGGEDHEAVQLAWLNGILGADR